MVMPNEEEKVTPEGSDVTETSEATDSTPSGATQTVDADDKSTDTTVDTSATESVPYSRFREKNEESKYWQERARKLEDAQSSQSVPTPTPPSASDQAVKQQLEGLGFITKEQQQAEIERIDQDEKVREQIVRLEGKYSGKDGRPKFNRDKVINHALDKKISNLEMAYKDMNEQKLMDWHVKQAVVKTKGVKAEKSDGSGSGQAGTTSQDLRNSIREGDKGALRTYLKRFAPRFDE